MRMIFLLFIAVCGFSACATSAQNHVGDTEAMSGRTAEEKAIYLMELTGAQSMGRQMSEAVMQQAMASMRQSSPDIPQRAVDIVSEVFSDFMNDQSEYMVTEIVPIYVEHYSEQDLNVLIDFYSSPTGRRLVETMPVIMEESMKAGSTWMQSHLPELQQQLLERLQAEGYGPGMMQR